MNQLPSIPTTSTDLFSHHEIGGTFAVRGCDPKKVLVGATEVIERSRQMA